MKKGTRYCKKIFSLLICLVMICSTFSVAAPTAVAANVAKCSVSLSNTHGGINIKWGAVSKAKKYKVYRKAAGESNWTVLGYTTSTSYFDDEAKSGKVNYYAVRPYVNNSLGKYDTYSVFCLKTPKATTTSNINKGINIKWSAVSGAKGYYVYRANGNGWTRIANVKTTQYTDASVKVGAQYTYTVRAYRGKTVSGFNKNGFSGIVLNTPTVKAANDHNGIKVTWNKITGASKYVIYSAEINKSTGEWSKWENRETVSSNTLCWVDENAYNTKTYKYTVRAVNGSCKSSYKATSSVYRIIEPVVSVENTDFGIELSWFKIYGATSYTVYSSQYDSSTGEWSSWKNMGKVDKALLSYIDKEVVDGIMYKYAVRANYNTVRSTYVPTTPLRANTHITHIYETVETITEATCTQVGQEKHSCVCGEYYYVELPALGHKINLNVDGNICIGGTKHYTCERCDYENNVAISVEGHKYILVNSVPATCTQEGSETYRCKVCGDEYTKELPISHKLQITRYTLPTCDKDGGKYFKCSVCSKEVTEVLPATGHNFEFVGIVQVTCQEAKETYQCTKCSSTEEKIIASISHDYKIISSVKPTCTTEGHEIKVCQRCNDRQETHYPSGHKYVVTSFKEATCTTAGYETKVCEVCKKEETVNIPAGHRGNITGYLAPTCTTDGYEKGICEECGVSYKNILPAIGHSFVDSKCTNCNKTFKQIFIELLKEKGYYTDGMYVYSPRFKDEIFYYDTSIIYWPSDDTLAFIMERKPIEPDSDEKDVLEEHVTMFYDENSATQKFIYEQVDNDNDVTLRMSADVAPEKCNINNLGTRFTIEHQIHYLKPTPGDKYEWAEQQTLTMLKYSNKTIRMMSILEFSLADFGFECYRDEY